MGPGQTLSVLARQYFDRNELPAGSGCSVLPLLERGAEPATDLEAFLSVLGHLWLRGHRPDWRVLDGTAPRPRARLPGYPFQRERYWLDLPPTSQHLPHRVIVR